MLLAKDHHLSTPPVAVTRQWDRIYLVLYALYFGLGMAARLLGWIHGDATWFVEAARRVLDGSFDLYSFRSGASVAPPLGVTYAYSPFMAVIIAPFVGLADAMGWGNTGAERLMVIPLLIADVMAMHQLRRLVCNWRPTVDERFLFLGILATLGLTGFWIATAFDGHDEGLMLLFLLLTLRLTPRSLLWGGICAGLALSAKHTAILALMPMGLVLLAGKHGRAYVPVPGGESRNESCREQIRGVKHAFLWGGIAVAIFVIFMAPALISNFPAVWYAFVILPSRLTMFGVGLPVWIDYAWQITLPPGEYAQRHEELIQFANWILFGSTAFPAIVISWAHRRGRPLSWFGSRLLGLIAFGAVAQVVLSKWVTGHYYQVPLALVFLWDAARTAVPTDRVNSRSFDTFPWIGLGAALVFRSVTQIGIPNLPGKDALVFVLFVILAIATLHGLKDET